VTSAARAPGTTVQASEPEELTPGTTVRLVPPARTPAAAIPRTGTGSQDHSPARPACPSWSWAWAPPSPTSCRLTPAA